MKITRKIFGRMKDKFGKATEQKTEQSYREVWNESAKTDVINAICHKHSVEDFEKAGKHTVNEIIMPVMPKNPVALDLGCGIGRIEKYLASHCKELYAVDVSDEMLRLAEERLKGIKNIHLSRVDGTSLKAFSEGKFDFVFSLLVLQHMEKEDAYLYLEEIYRVLKKEGTALIQFPNFLSDAYFNSFLADVRCPSPRHKNRVRPYTFPEVDKIMKSVGFKMMNVDNKTLSTFANHTEMMVLAKK